MGSLIPALPDDVTLQILARAPRQCYSKSMAMVSSSWNSALKSPYLFEMMTRLEVTEPWLYTALVREHGNGPLVLWFAKSKNASAKPKWALPLMPEEHRPVYGFRSAVTDELLYVLDGFQAQNPSGGGSSFLPATNKVSVFNSRTNRWSSVQGMRDARANFACAVVNGNLFVAGGERFVDVDSADEELEEINCNWLKSAEMYDPLADRWSRVCDMGHAKHFVDSCVVEGKFGIKGFVCEEELQFCEITEVFESAANKWVEFVEEDKNRIEMKRKDECEIPVNCWNVRVQEEEMKEFDYEEVPQACVQIAV